MALAALLLTGCSEVAYRSDGVDAVTRPGLYPAVRRDWRIVSGKEGTGALPFVEFFHLLDLPISAVADTFALPWDLADLRKQKVCEAFFAGHLDGLTPEQLRSKMTKYASWEARNRLEQNVPLTPAQLHLLAAADIRPVEMAAYLALPPDIALLLYTNHAQTITPNNRAVIEALRKNTNVSHVIPVTPPARVNP